jgi:vancomycin resistance protein YoaR
VPQSVAATSSRRIGEGSRMAVTSVTEARPQLTLRGRLFRRWIPAGILLMLILAGLAIAAAFAFDRAYEGRVLPGVSVAGVDVSGLSEADLRTRLTELQPLPSSVEIASDGRRVTVSPGALGASVDLDGAVAAALASGRASGALGDVPDRIAQWRDGRDIPLAASIDRNALRAWVTARAEQVRVAPRNAVIVKTPTGWSASDARIGKSLDLTAATAALEAALTNPNAAGATATVDLPVRTTVPDVDDLDAVLAISEAGRITQPLILSFRDGRTWTVPASKLQAAVTFVGGGSRPTPIVDGRIIAAAIAPYDKEIARKPTESLLLKTKSGSVFGFVPGKGGRSLDVNASTAIVGAVLAGRRDGSLPATATARLATTGVSPKLTAEEAAKLGPEMTLVGAWTTRFVPSEKNFNGANIRLPARFINGTVIRPGATFDFWGVVGPVTFSRGFGMGGFIESGRTNPTGAIGGGICSASTTMFNAAVRAGYQILERDNHAYYINRYPLGLDATVSKFRGRISQNMRFRNDTPNALFIRGISGGTWVRFEIYSKPTGRTVTFSSPSVSNVRKAIDTSVKTTELKRGQTERTETPTDGKDVVVTRTVRDASGRVIHSDRWSSHYVRVDGILRIGIG